ncbi:MAG: hypothetical protein HYY46_12105 [Deltaproteobacteria bacterium]|nr:hypothetical protein [Deltaproteobacteria bacterium]
MEEKIPRKWSYLLVLLLLLAGAILVWRSMRESGTVPSVPAPPGERAGEYGQSDRQIQQMERQITELRKEIEERSAQVGDLKSQLEEMSRALTSTQPKLEQARRERGPAAVSPPQPSAGVSGPRERAGSGEVPVAKENFPPKEPEPAGIWERPAEPGTYETIRVTSVFEEPSGSSRKVATIKERTEVTVVGSRGEWLEVRSKYGNPPGFVRREDAMFVKGKD